MELLSKIEKFANETPLNPAIVDKHATRITTYKELWDISGKICSKLNSNGIKKGDAVIICMERYMEYLACEIALMRGCITAVPVIPEYPRERIDYIKSDCNAKMIITEEFIEDINNYGEPLKCEYADYDRAFILYTSGSTGKPKGVVFSTAAIDDICGRTNTEPGVLPRKGTMAPLSFVASLNEYYTSFVSGGCNYIIDSDIRTDIEKLENYLAKNQITQIFLPPRLLKLFRNKDSALAFVVTGSERLSGYYDENLTVINCYGQSETGGNICTFTVDKPYDMTPIGKPKGNVVMRILDENGNELPDGTEGEICVEGHFAHEYLNLPEETAKIFEMLDDGRVRIHTGDIGYVREDGNFVYVNRKDWMVKINGQRVEPGEVETAIKEAPNVKNGAVKDFVNSAGQIYLCGYYVGENADGEEIKNYLKERLAPYMVPSYLVKLDKIPVNINGKLDRSQLPEPDIKDIKTTEYEAPQNEIEKAICLAMEKELNFNPIGRNDDFYELGGNSINAIGLSEECGIEGLAPQFILMGRTPKGIAEIYSENSKNKKPAIKKRENDLNEYPLNNTHIYQFNECSKIGYPTDINDMRGFWNIPGTVDKDRLKACVEDTFNSHKGYFVNFDMDKRTLKVSTEKLSVPEITIQGNEFEQFRKDKAKVIRDLKNDRLFETALINVDDKCYLYININHMLYDEASIKVLVKEISDRYNGTDTDIEETDVFDQCLYDTEIKHTDFYKAAVGFFESRYEKLSSEPVFERTEQQDVFTRREIAKNVSRDMVEKFFKKYGVSEITLLQAVLSLTLTKVFNKDNFTYMVVHDGRQDNSLKNLHGVLARSVYMVAHSLNDMTIREYLENIQSEYQQMVYYDVVNTVEMCEKYPAMKSDIYLNFQQSVSIDLTLNDGLCKYSGMGYYFDGIHMMTALNVVVQYTDTKQYAVTATSGFMDKKKAEEIINVFEETLISIVTV